MSTPTPFGAPMLKHFLIDPKFKNLNHGSFGTYPVEVQTALRQYQAEAEGRPDTFIRRTQPKGIDVSRQAVASFLNVPVNECVFVKNATTGVYTILHNLDFKDGDVLICFDTVYGGVERGFISLMEKTPLQMRKVEYTLPISHEEIVKRFVDVVRQAKADGLNVRIAVFDAVVSMPGVRFPFEKLVEACRDEGVLSLIDGAHGIGHIPLDLSVLKPDFFTSNCHKWLYAPRGCAVLYVPLKHQHLIRTTLPSSWGFIPAPTAPATRPSVMQGNGPATKSAFETLFEFVATSDDTPYLTIPTALKFRSEVCGGDDRIFAYLESLANEAADLLAAALGTEVLQERDLKPGEKSQLRRCGLTTIKLPFILGEAEAEGDGKSVRLTQAEAQTVAKWMEGELMETYGTFVPVFTHGDYLWTRLSAQVYLELSDFEWLAGVLKELCDRVAKREWIS